MREFKYDVIQLIRCVRDRSCIWDKTAENYKDRTERRNAWEEIFNTLEQTYDQMTMEQKRLTGEHILYKWTNIRDTFVKTLKTKLGRPKKKYLLYDHLNFLTKIVPEEERGTEYNEEPGPYNMKQEIEPETGVSSGIERDSFTITSEVEPETNFTITSVTSYGSKNRSKRNFDDTQSTDYNASGVSYSKKRSKRRDFNDAKSTDYNISEYSYSGKKRKSNRLILAEDMDDSRGSVVSKKKSKKACGRDAEDHTNGEPTNDSNDIDFVDIDDNDPRIMNEDEAFFASLLPTIVKYNEDERLEFRIEVLNVMKKIKDKRIWAM